MLIELKIKRAGGTKVSMGEQDYHFKPASAEEGAPHVAEVTNEEHIARFLGITEGYRIAPGSTAAAAPALTGAPQGSGTSTGGQGGSEQTGSARMVLKRGDEEVNLEDMSRSKLLAFCAENDIEVTTKMKAMNVGDLRAEIFRLATTAEG